MGNGVVDYSNYTVRITVTSPQVRQRAKGVRDYDNCTSMADKDYTAPQVRQEDQDARDYGSTGIHTSSARALESMVSAEQALPNASSGA